MSNKSGRYNIAHIKYLGFTVRTINDMSAGFSFFLVLYFINNISLPLSTATLILSTYGIGTLLSSILSGKLVDHIQPRTIICCYFIIKSISLLFIATSHTKSILSAAVFCMGFTDYGICIALIAFLFKYTNNDRKKLSVLSGLASASNLGMGIAIFLAGFLFYVHFKALLLILSALSFLVIALLFYPDIKTTKKLNITTENNARKNNNYFRLTLLLFCILCIGIMFSQIRTIGIVYLHHAFPSYALKHISDILLLNIILVVILQNWLTKFFYKRNRHHIMAFGALLIGVGMMLLVITKTFLAPILACVIYTIGEMLFFPNAQLFCANSGKKTQQGFSISLFYIIYALSLIIGPIMSSRFFSFIQHTKDVWVACGFTGIICFCLCLTLGNTNTAA